MKKLLNKEEYIFDLPKSMSTVWDVFYMISTNPNRAQLGRLFAALIGVMVTNKQNIPKYNISDCDLLNYGAVVQEWLAEKKISPITVLNIGTELFEFLSSKIATQEDVQSAENFSTQDPED